MDVTTFTSEDRAVLHQLAESPGWALLMERLFIPRIQQITQLLDRPSIEQSGHADFIRGEKHAYVAQLEMLYNVAGIPNPLDVHALGLLKVASRRSEEANLIPRVHIIQNGGALCGAQPGSGVAPLPPVEEGGLSPSTIEICRDCETIAQEIRVRRGRGRASLV